jgi:hypothetical protein
MRQTYANTASPCLLQRQAPGESHCSIIFHIEKVMNFTYRRSLVIRPPLVPSSLYDYDTSEGQRGTTVRLWAQHPLLVPLLVPRSRDSFTVCHLTMTLRPLFHASRSSYDELSVLFTKLRSDTLSSRGGCADVDMTSRLTKECKALGFFFGK